MRYLLLIGGEESGAPPLSSKEICAADDGLAWVEDVKRGGSWVSGLLLRPPAEATTVRVRDDEVLRTDGPFAETKEQIGGLAVIECADLDAAVEIAAAHPVARFGLVEVRPLW
ncbi:MAG: transcription initiation protein [Actinophytocola sp.]|uniref:YciI family protein n=1 Tax=Actinophytocola sp. TaxID=1872138 RepID=UPI001327D102|nr:YciI family protein [Actinophytocola sp.]MPZ82145.1 transcription initiation protein [Actinophytocola sp.]